MHAMWHVAHAHAHGIVHAMWHVAHAHACVSVCVCCVHPQNHALRLSCECVRVHTCMRACVRVLCVCVLCVCNSVRVTACGCAYEPASGAEGRLGRKGLWGGKRSGAEGSLVCTLGRKGAWGGREYGAEGRLGLKGVWGGREYGAEGRLGRKVTWG